MSIPSVVKDKLNKDLWIRGGNSSICDALTFLGIDKTSEFAEFYQRYWGPFHSSRIGHELLDIVEQEESIISATQAVRDDFGFADRFVVVSRLMGLSILVYDNETQMVFDVDFEGGEALLATGKLKPRWQTWNQFLTDYFG